LKILLATYSAETHTSYGIVTRELWKRLKALNPSWNIMQHGWFHRTLEPVPWHIEPTTNMTDPAGDRRGDVYGSLSFESVVSKFRPDLVWTLADPYMCDYMGQYRPRYGFKLLKYCPVDGVPQPPSWIDALKDCDMFVPITKFGAQALAPYFGGEVKPHIYHGVDIDRFFPFAPDVKAKIRPKDRGTDAKIIGFIGHNQFRKMNWAMFPILKYLRTGAYFECYVCGRLTLAPWDPVTRRLGDTPNGCDWCLYEPDGTRLGVGPGIPINAHLWMHCFNRGNVTWRPERMKQVWGLEDSVMFTTEMKAEEGIPDKDIPYLINCFDVYLTTSGGEGFNIPAVEAMACGIPVVYSNYSAHPEVVGHAGLPIRTAAMIPDQVEPIDRAVVDIADAVKAVKRLLTDKALYNHCALQGLSRARDVFSWDLIAEQWTQLINSSFSAKKVVTRGVSV
jgi:glycosyltransferase involved in cell wall biosynthesis